MEEGPVRYTFPMFTARKRMTVSHDRGAWPWRRMSATV